MHALGRGPRPRRCTARARPRARPRRAARRAAAPARPPAPPAPAPVAGGPELAGALPACRARHGLPLLPLAGPPPLSAETMGGAQAGGMHQEPPSLEVPVAASATAMADVKRMQCVPRGLLRCAHTSLGKGAPCIIQSLQGRVGLMARGSGREGGASPRRCWSERPRRCGRRGAARAPARPARPWCPAPLCSRARVSRRRPRPAAPGRGSARPCAATLIPSPLLPSAHGCPELTATWPHRAVTAALQCTPARARARPIRCATPLPAPACADAPWRPHTGLERQGRGGARAPAGPPGSAARPAARPARRRRPAPGIARAPRPRPPARAPGPGCWPACGQPLRATSLTSLSAHAAGTTASAQPRASLRMCYKPRPPLAAYRQARASRHICVALARPRPRQPDRPHTAQPRGAYTAPAHTSSGMRTPSTPAAASAPASAPSAQTRAPHAACIPQRPAC